MSTFHAILLPLSVLLIGLGALIGGRVGQALLGAGAVGAGVACVLALA